jgi:CheY-like chemotaxis protein
MPGETHKLGYLLSDDLIFVSRITGTARDLGLVVESARTVERLLEACERQRPACVMVDLAYPGMTIGDLMAKLGEKCTPLPRVVAYGSHVDTETLKAARAAGCDPVLPRSKFVEDLPSELDKWIAGERSA